MRARWIACVVATAGFAGVCVLENAEDRRAASPAASDPYDLPSDHCSDHVGLAELPACESAGGYGSYVPDGPEYCQPDLIAHRRPAGLRCDPPPPPR